VVATDIASAADSFPAGEKLARSLARPGLRSVFVLSDGLNVNGSERRVRKTCPTYALAELRTV